jgi:CRISPR-associated protein Cas6
MDEDRRLKFTFSRKEQLLKGMKMKVDLKFQLFGNEIMVDHGYSLFSALSRLNPDFHEAYDIGMALVRGSYIGNGKLALKNNSYLRLRLPVEKLSQYISLAGHNLELDGHVIRLGVPNTASLVPSTALYAHLVTTKNGYDLVRFEDEIERQFTALDCKGKLTIGKRRTFRIHGRQVVGYSVLASQLTADESIRLQESGLGGRRKLGCGFFEPWTGG